MLSSELESEKATRMDSKSGRLEGYVDVLPAFGVQKPSPQIAGNGALNGWLVDRKKETVAP